MYRGNPHNNWKEIRIDTSGGNPHSIRAEGIRDKLPLHDPNKAATRPNMDTMGGWFKNPHSSPFTQGFQQGWGDQRSPFYGGDAIPLPKDTMEREGTPAIPLPKATWQTRPPWQGDAPWQTGPLGHEAAHTIGDQASYVPSERVYPRFVIDDLLRQGVTVPNEIRQIAPDSFQITPKGMTPSPLRPREYYT